jgi:hypothetical protein
MSRSTSNQHPINSITEVSPIPTTATMGASPSWVPATLSSPAWVPCRRLLATISVTVGRSDDEAGNEIV